MTIDKHHWEVLKQQAWEAFQKQWEEEGKNPFTAAAKAAFDNWLGKPPDPPGPTKPKEYQKTQPEPGEEYEDVDGRVLVVTTVQPGDSLGREVVGKIFDEAPNGQDGDAYSCDLQTWADDWRDKRPRWVGTT